MENSILNSTKKVLGMDANYTAFDLDIITHINSAFSILCQLGIGPPEGFMIEDRDAEWSDFIGSNNKMNLVRSYVFLKVRMLFDPPTTSFLIDAQNAQIAEMEWRISAFREEDIPWIGAN